MSTKGVLEKAVVALSSWVGNNAWDDIDVETLQAIKAALPRAELEGQAVEYIRHKLSCDFYSIPSGKCDCGFEELFLQLEVLK